MRRLHFHSIRFHFVRCLLFAKFIGWHSNAWKHHDGRGGRSALSYSLQLDAGFYLNYVVFIQTGHKTHAREYDSYMEWHALCILRIIIAHNIVQLLLFAFVACMHAIYDLEDISYFNGSHFLENMLLIMYIMIWYFQPIHTNPIYASIFIPSECCQVTSRHTHRIEFRSLALTSRVRWENWSAHFPFKIHRTL